MVEKKKSASKKKGATTTASKTIKKTAPKKSTVKKEAAKNKTAAKKNTAAKNNRSIKTTASTLKKAVKKIEKKTDTVKQLADAAVEGILEVKGRNIAVLNLKNIQNRVCDYFIICQADSTTQVNAIANSVEETVKKLTGERPYRKEGFENSEWILVDYVTVVVHIFQSQIRSFYNLESLWADAEITNLAFD